MMPMRGVQALIALAAVAVVLVGLISSGAISGIMHTLTQNAEPEAPDGDRRHAQMEITPDSWSELVDTSGGGVSV
jgi:hypothetical protein